MAGQGADLRGKSARAKAVRLSNCFTFQQTDLQANPALLRQRSLQTRTVGYSTISEALTETGPGHHEGNSGVSVKSTIQPVLRTIRALVRNFWLLLFPRQK